MSYTPLPTKEAVFMESDRECDKLAKSLKRSNSVFFDEEFPPNDTSLGYVPTEEDPIRWIPPHQFPPYSLNWNETHTWHIWRDPWPFHVYQNDVGDCWLIASLQAIARRKVLLDQIIPKRWYTMSHGIVQIRLLINGEWKVLKIDFHLPQKSNSFERYAYMVKKQIWVAFIEKGFAKIRKSYEKLSGGVAGIALQQLTGAMTFSVFMEKFNNDENRVWEFIQENRNSKFILTVSTPTIEEESEKKQLLEEYGIRDCHEYSVLDAQVYMGHRLILLAGSGPFGKPKSVRRWGHLPSYKEIREDWCAVDLGFSEFGTFWIDMSELFQYFEYVTVCQYREKWKEIRIRRNVVANTKNTEILNIVVQTNCELVIEVARRDALEEYQTMRKGALPLYYKLASIETIKERAQSAGKLFQKVVFLVFG